MSKSSETDKRYDRYAEIFDNPINEHVIELGNRVLHWSFMENFAPYVAHGAIQQHAEDAVEQARRRDPEAARRYDQRPRRRSRGKPGEPVWLPVRPDGTVVNRRSRRVKITPAQIQAVQDRTRENLNTATRKREADASAPRRSKGRSR